MILVKNNYPLLNKQSVRQQIRKVHQVRDYFMSYINNLDNIFN